MNTNLRLFAAAALLATAAGCGNKGPLVHPTAPADELPTMTTTPADATLPAPASTAPAAPADVSAPAPTNNDSTPTPPAETTPPPPPGGG